jgi:hypothetical protein
VPPERLATATTCAGMEIDFCADLGNSGVRACSMIGIRRHLERADLLRNPCGIRTRSSLREKRETPGSTPDPGVSLSDVDQTS